MKRYVCPFVVFLLLLGSFGAVSAQEPEGEEGPRAGRRGRGGRSGGDQEEPKIKPYEEVITKEAKSDEGVFTIHRIKDKLFYEIPKSELGKDFILVQRIAKTINGAGYGGQKVRTPVVRWVRRGDRILLKSVSYSVVADKSRPVSRAVEAANMDSIIRAFNIKAIGENDAAVIEVTPLFTTDIFEMSAKSRLQARGMDRSRSFLEEAKSFPINIEVKAIHTYTKPADPPGRRQQAPAPRRRFGGRGMQPGSATILMHYSMVKLPEDPMMPRLFDPRVGYFTVRQVDYGRDAHKAETRTYITRWRLEKKDPTAALSEPVKPIVYWIDPATPKKWIPYMKAGVEKWQAAFEMAGFKNAILAKEAPTPEEDPDWSPEDARYSVIRWLPSTVANASGPHVHDPRTGEILESDIQFYHNVQNLGGTWYFAQASAVDKRARHFPLTDELNGKMLEYVTAHEVGHTLGFQHNMKASSMYTVEQVRDPKWVKTMGHTPTLMDYSRLNYVAQPEDGIDVEDLIPKIGPYDKWATMWGYKPIPDADSPDAEKATLRKWAREQDTKPWLRFTTGGRGPRGHDPGELTEAVGDSDAVRATELGLKNLKRVMEYLVSATKRDGERWDDLSTLYGTVLGQWVREMTHVTAIVGGFDSQEKTASQAGPLYKPVSPERQAAAVQFLIENAFSTPDYFIRPDILRLIESSGVISRINNSQTRVLSSLLNTARLGRLIEQNAMDGDGVYRVTQFLSDVRRGIWSEVGDQSVRMDAYRRALQRSYIGIIDTRLNGSRAVSDDARALYRGELRTLDAELDIALQRSGDQETRYHLQDCRDQIARILDPKFEPSTPAPATGPFGRRAFYEALEVLEGQTPEFCWPELIIRADN